jgi:hypothetical protein
MFTEDSTISESPPPSGGFSDFFSSVGDLLLDTAKEVLPVWTKNELNLQENPARTEQTLYQQYPGQSANMNAPYWQQTSQVTPVQSAAPDIKPAFLDLNFGGTHVSGLAVAAIGVSILAALWLLRK